MCSSTSCHSSVYACVVSQNSSRALLCIAQCNFIYIKLLGFVFQKKSYLALAISALFVLCLLVLVCALAFSA